MTTSTMYVLIYDIAITKTSIHKSEEIVQGPLRRKSPVAAWVLFAHRQAPWRVDSGTIEWFIDSPDTYSSYKSNYQ